MIFSRQDRFFYLYFSGVLSIKGRRSNKTMLNMSFFPNIVCVSIYKSAPIGQIANYYFQGHTE